MKIRDQDRAFLVLALALAIVVEGLVSHRRRGSVRYAPEPEARGNQDEGY